MFDPSLIRQYVNHVLNDGSRHYLSRSNIFLYPRKVIEHDLVLDFPRIKSATVSRTSLFGRTLIVTLEERAFFALWCSGKIPSTGECYQMDDGGFIFADASDQNPAKYMFSGGLPPIATTSAQAAYSPTGQVFAHADLPELTALLGRLADAGFVPEGVDVENERDFSIPLKDLFTIKGTFGDDALVKNLQLVLSNPPLRGNEAKIEYIDMRFGNRVYYKMKDGVVMQTAR